MINFGLVGYGRFGINYAKNLTNLGSKTNLLYYCCNNEKPIDEYNKFAKFTNDYKSLIDESLVDVVIVATPPQNHYEICKYALTQGKHVICEKPFVLRVGEAQELHNLADEKRLNLIVDFTHLFNPNFTELSERFYEFDGKINIVMEHSNYGPFRDYDALIDYGSHGLAMSNFIMRETGVIHSCRKLVGGSRSHDGLYCITLRYNEGDAVIYCGNTARDKKCRFHLISDKKQIVYIDDGSFNSIRNMLSKTADAVKNGKIISNSELALNVTKQLSECMEELNARQDTSSHNGG